MEKEEIEILEEDEEVVVPEKIVVEEKHESKYDDLKPRTEMSELTKEEKKQILEEQNVKENIGSNSQSDKIALKKSKLPLIIFIVMMIVVGIILGYTIIKG